MLLLLLQHTVYNDFTFYCIFSQSLLVYAILRICASHCELRMHYHSTQD